MDVGNDTRSISGIYIYVYETNLFFLFFTLPKGQVIKKGQVVCYLEQLGTQQPVEVCYKF